MSTHRVVVIAGVVVLATGAASASSAGCNGTGVTPVCTYADGALDPEAGCGAPVEASVYSDGPEEDAPADGASPDSAAPPDAIAPSDAGTSIDAADAPPPALPDGAVQDAHNDSKG